MKICRLKKLAWLLGLVPFVCGGEPLVGNTFHTDGRDTPAFYVPPQAGASGAMDQLTAENYLRDQHDLFKLPADLSNLRLISAQRSLLGMHYRYQQVLNGLKVDGGEIVVSLREDGSVFQVFNSTYPVAAIPAMPGNLLSRDNVLDIAWNHLRVHGRLIMLPSVELIYVPQKTDFRLVYRTLISTEAPFGHWEHRIDAVSGEIISVRSAAISRKPVLIPDFSAYKGAVWSRANTTAAWTAAALAKAAQPALLGTTVNGTGRVFDPDPRSVLMNDALLDSSPSSSFTTAYFTRTLPGITSNAGFYSLTGPWVTIAEIESPTSAPSTTVSGNWTATRGTNAFDDAMCYFHIDQSQRYLQSLGFTNVQHGSINVDSDGVAGDDNSHFMSSGNYLAFGHGGVDDDEDADVILHEYGHAITFSIVPTWGSGGDTGAIGEGFGDYWGGSYSYVSPNGSTYHPEWAFTWDGHSADTWSGRFMNLTNLTYDSSHTYAAHETISSIANYSDQLWSAPIFQAFVTLMQMGYARTNMDRIMIQSFYGIGGSPKMRDLAYAIVNTASNLYPSGQYASVFYQKFVNQSIIPLPTMQAPLSLYPGGGEIFLTGDTVRVIWNRNSAPSLAAERLTFAPSTNVTSIFQDSVESGTNGWTRSHYGLVSDWNQVGSAYRSATHSWYAADDTFTNDQFLVSPQIAVVAGSSLSFWHSYNLESGFDGGVVEISTNASTWTDLGSNATQNGYSMTISSSYQSPLSGRHAFSGSSSGFIQTIIPLTNFAGRSIYLRFREADDNSTSVSGWWVDDITVSTDVAWSNVTTTATNVTSYLWKLPGSPTTTAVIRIQQFGTGYQDSSWLQSKPFTISADTDGDGIPDAWEIKYFSSLTNANATTDSDRDGFSDLSEYRAGTLPNNSTSVFQTVTASNRTDGGFSIQWLSISNRDYSVARGTNLIDFTVIATNLPATPPVNTYIDTNAFTGSLRFYQIRAP